MSQRESEAGSAFVPVAAKSSTESSGIVMPAFSSMRAMRNAGDEKRPMRIELGVAPSAARLGSKASGHPKGPYQPDSKRNRHAEMRGSGMTGPASLDKSDDPLTTIERIGFRHRESPPRGE
jgi:hypothetical protein